MALNDTQLAELKVELDTDPKGLGYSGKPHPDVAELLNEVGLSSEIIPNVDIPTDDVMDAIKADELNAVNTNRLLFFLQRMSQFNGVINMTENGPFEVQVRRIFAGATNTLAALAVLKTRDASRAEVLFWANVIVTMFDVAEARQLP